MELLWGERAALFLDSQRWSSTLGLRAQAHESQLRINPGADEVEPWIGYTSHQQSRTANKRNAVPSCE